MHIDQTTPNSNYILKRQ